MFVLRSSLFLVILVSIATSSGASDRYFYCDDGRAYYCKPPSQYSEGCYVVRDNTSVIRVGEFPVISSSQASEMMQRHTAPVAADPVAACCGGYTTGDCKCKTLGCELTLTPPDCKKTGKTTKTKIPFETYGKIPKEHNTIDCYKKIRDFNHLTKVPTIICTTQKCVEISTETLQCEIEDCKPGCSFKVCIPINNCETKTVECSLKDKDMPHTVYLRTDPDTGNKTYDVYVNNNADPTSPFHAGGMPKRWLVMHCASKDEVQRKFPGMVASNRGKKVQPETTDADVDIELAFDKGAIEAYLKQFAPTDLKDLENPKKEIETRNKVAISKPNS